MVKNYALIKEGLVINKILWDPDDQPDYDYGIDEGVTAVEMPEGVSIDLGYSYSDGQFTAPPLTPEELAEIERNKTASNVSLKAFLISEAGQKISILQDAVDLEMASEEEAADLPLWKKYRVLLSRIDANTPDTINWPEKPAALPPGNVNK